MTPVYRPAVRVVVADPGGRVLLLRYRSAAGDVFWVPPGGGLERGEDHASAARRELEEELGLTGLALEDVGWRRRLVIEWGGTEWDQDEVWFLARCDDCDLGGARLDALRAEGADELRWWTVAEIDAATGAVFAPRALAELLPGLLAGERPAGTVDIGP